MVLTGTLAVNRQGVTNYSQRHAVTTTTQSIFLGLIVVCSNRTFLSTESAAATMYCGTLSKS